MRREKIERIQEALVLCREPRKLTEIMRLVNVAFYKFNELVDPLVEKGFMVKVPCPKSVDKKTKYKWMTTANGRVLLGEIGEVLGKLKI